MEKIKEKMTKNNKREEAERIRIKQRENRKTDVDPNLCFSFIFYEEEVF